MRIETRDRLEGILGSTIKKTKAVSGGDIAEAYLIETSSQRIFCKLMQGQSARDMLQAEMDGLEQIRNTGSIKAPQVFFCEDLAGQVCLGMEFIESKSPSPREMEKLGEQLAELHKSSLGKFGYQKDNFIGSLPQSNRLHASWVSFYVEERLSPQYQIAVSRSLMPAHEIPDNSAMIETLSPYFEGVTPALLHGDLWGGNYLISITGEPYLIDPAVYYGDPVVDLAMSRLFGGFSVDFYKAYNTNGVVAGNQEDKTSLYQLYYLLVHLNLFGSSYYGSVKRIMQQYF